MSSSSKGKKSSSRRDSRKTSSAITGSSGDRRERRKSRESRSQDARSGRSAGSRESFDPYLDGISGSGHGDRQGGTPHDLKGTPYERLVLDGSHRDRLPKVLLPIFSENGVWVRPDCVRDFISEAHVESHAAPIEEHIGNIDPSVPVDLASSILAFEFIDSINEDILNHYLPLVDEAMGKELGLRHNPNRLSLPGDPPPRAQSSHSGGSPFSQENFDDDSIANYDDNDRYDAGSMSGSVSQSMASHDERFESQQSWNVAAASGQVSAVEEPFDKTESDPQLDACYGDEEDLEGLTPIDAEEADEMRDEVVSRLENERKLSAEDALLINSTTMNSLHCSTTEGSLHQSTTLGSLHQSSTTLSGGPSQFSGGPSQFYVEDSPSCSEGSFDEYGHEGLPPIMSPEGDLGGSRPRTQETQNSGPRASIPGLDRAAAAEAELWPHACTLEPKTASPARTRKLRAVDSVPDSRGQVRDAMPHDTPSVSAWASVGPTSSTPLGDGEVGPLGLPRILPVHTASSLELASSFDQGHQLNDPASANAPVTSVYAPGAGKVRRPGQHRLERLRLNRYSARKQRTMLKHAQAGAQSARTRGRFADGSTVGQKGVNSARGPLRPGQLAPIPSGQLAPMPPGSCADRQAVSPVTCASPVGAGEMGATSVSGCSPLGEMEHDTCSRNHWTQSAKSSGSNLSVAASHHWSAHGSASNLSVGAPHGPHHWSAHGSGSNLSVGAPHHWSSHGSGSSLSVGAPHHHGSISSISVGVPHHWSAHGSGSNLSLGAPHHWSAHGSSSTLSVGATASSEAEALAKAKALANALAKAGHSTIETIAETVSRADLEAKDWAARQALISREIVGTSIEDFAAMHLKNEASMPRVQKVEDKPRNSVCPFSHESMPSSVNLRCGHCFALNRLEVARRAPAICSNAGFAAKGPLICALCGDQDMTTSTPAASRTITTYSSNTDAYLGGIRKDYQMPLHLGGESGRASSLLPRVAT